MSRYREDPNGEWCVLDYDGNPLPARWATEDDAHEYGVAGKYLLSGLVAARVSTTEAAS